MSSSSEVSLAILEEITEYNKVEASGNFDTIDFISESLSGDMQTSQSSKVGGGRLPTGQFVTGQTIGGTIASELTPNDVWRELILAASMSASWAAPASSTADTLTIDKAAGTITSAVYDFTTLGLAANEPVVLSGFSNAVNNVAVFVIGVTASVLTVIMDEDMVDETGGGDEVVTRPAYAELGTTRRSFSIAKAFLDLTDKGINYTGLRLESLKVNLKYGDAAQVEAALVGAGHSIAKTATEKMTYGRTVNAVATERSLTPGANMNFIALDGAVAGYCIESLEFTLGNAHQAQNCVASLAPRNQIPNTADIAFNMSAYLEDANFDMHDLRASQLPISVGYALGSDEGGFAFYMPEVQLSFPDAQSGGRDSQVMLNMSGTARNSSSYGNAMRIWQW